MPQQIYPGQFKFHTIAKEARQAKQRVNRQRRMAKNREQQRQHQINHNLPSEQ